MPHSHRNVRLGVPHISLVDLIKSSLSRLTECDDVIRCPPFQPCLGPPTFSPSLLVPSVTDNLIQNMSAIDLMDHLFAIRTFRYYLHKRWAPKPADTRSLVDGYDENVFGMFLD